MPKDKRIGRSAPLKSRGCPYNARGKGREGDDGGEQSGKEDWEDALCPICLESPHNAVLLMCSSHSAGCRPYMCNTSHRHSNCLDQYQKTQAGLQKSHGTRQAFSTEHTESSAVDSLHTGNGLNMRIVGAYPSAPARRPPRVSATNSSEHALGDGSDMENVIIEALNSRITTAGSVASTRRLRRNTHLPLLARNEANDAGMQFLGLETGMEMDSIEGLSSVEEHGTGASLKSKHLICPLCRGEIFGWRVVNAARKYFNDKARSCSHESCMFLGTYQELRVHARCEHPFMRPCDVDPTRQRDWLRMERQTEIGDVLSTIGAANEDVNIDDGRWWSSFFLLHLFGSTVPVVYEGRLRDRYQGLSLRAGSVRLREFVEGMSLGADGLSDASDSRTNGAEATNSSEGQVRRQLRPRGL